HLVAAQQRARAEHAKAENEQRSADYVEHRLRIAVLQRRIAGEMDRGDGFPQLNAKDLVQIARAVSEREVALCPFAEYAGVARPRPQLVGVIAEEGDGGRGGRHRTDDDDGEVRDLRAPR